MEENVVLDRAKLPPFLSGMYPKQLGILVPDIEEGIRMWSVLTGRDDWRMYTYSPDWVPELTYRGQPGRFSMRLALLGAEPQVELIQPLDGPSLYHEWIDEHGYGMHHVGFWVPSIDEVAAQATAAGIEITQSGRGYGMDGDGGFIYLDTQESAGMILEAIEVPKQRRPSEPIPL